MALSVSGISCGAASLPHNHPWVLGPPLASASAFFWQDQSIPRYPRVYPALPDRWIPSWCGDVRYLGTGGPGLPLGSRMQFPRQCGWILSTLSCCSLLATTFSRPRVCGGVAGVCVSLWSKSGTAMPGQGSAAFTPGLANLGAPISLTQKP